MYYVFWLVSVQYSADPCIFCMLFLFICIFFQYCVCVTMVSFIWLLPSYPVFFPPFSPALIRDIWSLGDMSFIIRPPDGGVLLCQQHFRVWPPCASSDCSHGDAFACQCGYNGIPVTLTGVGVAPIAWGECVYKDAWVIILSSPMLAPMVVAASHVTK